MAKMQIIRSRRHRLKQIKRDLQAVIADDAKAAPKHSKIPKPKVLDNTVVFTTTTKLTDMAANLITRINQLLANV